MSRVKNDAFLLLRIRQDKKSRENDDADMLLWKGQDKMRGVKNDADLLLGVRQDKKSRV